MDTNMIFKYINRHKYPIIYYHGVVKENELAKIGNYQGKHVFEREFYNQMNYIREYYMPISLSELINDQSDDINKIRNAIIITFDDGYLNNYEYAFPILKKFNIPATIFLTTNFINKKKPLWPDRIEYALMNTKKKEIQLSFLSDISSLYLKTEADRMNIDSIIRRKIKKMHKSEVEGALDEIEEAFGCSLSHKVKTWFHYAPLEWKQAREMLDSGLINFGSHTVNHYILTKCDPETIRYETGESRKIIRKELGISCESFAYPNGRPTDFNDVTRKIISQIGYSTALTTVNELASQYSDIFNLPRLPVKAKTSINEFKGQLSGRSILVERLKRPVKIPMQKAIRLVSKMIQLNG
jgi:peptidoglycan/xylan/chitin deacetylase (PgdA/CDA1 family)